MQEPQFSLSDIVHDAIVQDGAQAAMKERGVDEADLVRAQVVQAAEVRSTLDSDPPSQMPAGALNPYFSGSPTIS